MKNNLFSRNEKAVSGAIATLIKHIFEFIFGAIKKNGGILTVANHVSLRVFKKKKWLFFDNPAQIQ